MKYQNIILPNYEHCILNTITSILKYYNVETKHKSSQKIDELGSMIRIETYLAEGKPLKKSTHCGLSKEEMEVPVIVATHGDGAFGLL